MPINRGALSAQLQRGLMKDKFKLTLVRQQELRKIAAKSGDKSLKFWGNKLGKRTMTLTQLKKTLNKLADAEGSPELKHVETSIKTYLDKVRATEAEKQDQAKKEEVRERNINYRRKSREEMRKGNNPLVRTSGTVYKTANEMSVSINARPAEQTTKDKTQGVLDQSPGTKPPPALPQMPLD